MKSAWDQNLRLSLFLQRVRRAVVRVVRCAITTPNPRYLQAALVRLNLVGLGIPLRLCGVEGSSEHFEEHLQTQCTATDVAFADWEGDQVAGNLEGLNFLVWVLAPV